MSEMLYEKLVKTKKDHRCFGCCGVIPTGATAKKQTWIWEGEFNHGYLCQVCEIVLRDFDGDEWYEGDLNVDSELWESAAHEFEERTGTSYNSAIMPFCKAKTA